MNKPKFAPVSPNINFPDMEKKMLDYWKKKSIQEKYLHKNDKSQKRFSFLDGPITANNSMGVHHAWGRTYKDLWQRYYNMKGYRQRFQNGFDCQGLWIEVEVEKELGIRNKKDIENLVSGDKKASIAKFVQLCKERVLKFSKIQTEQTIRLGNFMDWDNSYYTMSDENNYMIWHFLKTCYKNGWIYKSRDSVPWCPRCQTAISQHEMLTEDYKELTHESIFLKFPIISKGWEKTSLIAWTTTPWTIPANVATAVHKDFTYAIWENTETCERIIFLAKDENGNTPIRLLHKKEASIDTFMFDHTQYKYKKIKEISGKDLIGLKYIGPFDQLPLAQNAYKEKPNTFHIVVDGSDIAVASEGTGILHEAPGNGAEDFHLAMKMDLPIISQIDDTATYIEGMGEFTGKDAKKHPEIIIDYLKNYDQGKFLFKTLQYTHRYPACWRCKTELVWKVADEWYIAMDKKAAQGKTKKTLRQMMMDVAKKIRWLPAFGLDRELDWLKNMHDWLISKKNRYWGLALPIYECNKCGNFEIIGSKDELEKRAVSGWNEFIGHSPHKPFIDEVKIKCSKCGDKVSRIADVGNVWLDAGIVPYSTYIDPKSGKLSYTTDKKYWQEWFPADFITESFPGQFKNWFYSMIAMSTVLEYTNPFKNVLGFASVLGEDGRPMHKSWGNAIDFNEGADKIGVDVMRWMFVTQDPQQNILFGYKKADETRRKFHLLLWNIYNFFVTYASVDDFNQNRAKIKLLKRNVLDKWIISQLNNLILTVTNSLDSYDAFSGTHAIEDFISNLSQWYVRRSRDRIGPTAENEGDKKECYQTLYEILVTVTKLLAPANPYIADEIYQNLTQDVSVHLANWPDADKSLIDENLEKEMISAREITEKGHAQRKEKQLKVRQPLWSLEYKLVKPLGHEIEKLIQDELNIKNVAWKKGTSQEVALDPGLDTHPNLLKEGEARDLIRKIQLKRKEVGCGLTEKINIILPSWPREFTDEIKRQTLAKKIAKGTSISIERI